MHLSIIGTGNMAAGLARRLAAGGVELTIGARERHKADELVLSLGTGTATDMREAARAPVIILATPFDAAAAIIGELGDLEGKLLIDISNPITPDYMALTVGFSSSAAEEIQKLAPKARVAKAFNTIFAPLFALPVDSTREVQVFYAADQDGDKEALEQVIEVAGFVPVHAGPLANARYLEPIGELNIHFGFALGRGTAIAPSWKWLQSADA